jgi:spore coat polysaccharide biosynthesis protein SpsF (cytidylyltransferase family)/aryl-alcohol dehydrogenase-like predicted oxidoreductase
MNIEKRSSVVVIQSRLSSSRLPGKALLPIKGIPLIVLVAKRAANTGKNVIVVTSIDPSDDVLCETLENYNIQYLRGSLNNVLERFYNVLNEMNDDTFVFRLTADNVLPDGSLLDEIEERFIVSAADIIRCDPEVSNLPYGVAVEVTTVKCIREAYANVEDDYDKEHVTPYIYRNKKSEIFISKKVSGNCNLRVTIDTFDDYISVRTLFDGVDDIINSPINHLISNFKGMKYHPYYEPSKKPMTLGGAQLGMDYGITNIKGKIHVDEAVEIIRHAITEGVKYIDTAAAYSESEKVIGKALLGGWANRVKIITKLLPFENNIKDGYTEVNWKLCVKNSVLKSCFNLNTSVIDTLMLHRAEYIKNEIIVSELLKLRDDGVINNIGISVQNPNELKYSLRANFVSLIQMPFNILDYRWDLLIESLRAAREKRGLIVHARSVLLQGLLCSDEDEKWKIAGVKNSKQIINWLRKKYKQHKKMSISDLCIGYVNSQDWIDSVVVGVDTKKNLFSNLQSVSMPLMSKNSLTDIVKSRPLISEDSLDPSKWGCNV